MSRYQSTFALFLVALLAGCAAPATEHYYRLSYASDNAMSTATPAYELVIDTVQIPEAINRPQFVVQQTGHEALVLEEQRWLEPIENQMTSAILANLRSQLPDAWLSTQVDSKSTLSRYRLSTSVQQLLMENGKQIQLDYTWMLLDANKTVLKRQHKSITVNVHSNSYDGNVAAVSEAMQQVANDIAQELKVLRNTAVSVTPK